MSSKKENKATNQSKAKQKAQQKEQKRKKQELKTEKSQKKKEAKELEDEEDIQTTIAKIEKKKKSTVIVAPAVTSCDQPGPRSNFSIVQSPLNDELIIFGGQYYDGQVQYVYGETYRWNFAKNEWRFVEGSPSPNPRSCHQAVVHKHHMYVFGGEFSTIRQFYHFRDLWRFDLKTNAWEEIKASGPSPSPRSGHRMIGWKSYIIVFGGFHDTFRDCKYFNDLYLFNIPEERWEKIDVSTISVPCPRSGCGFFLHPTNDTAFVYGGYVRDKKVSGTDLCDMWQLSLRAQPGMAVPVKAIWERLSRKGTAPSRRSGASFAVHKSRALVFGGVFDKDTQGLTMESEFFNELYAFDMDRKRWYVLDYNTPKTSQASKERRAARKRLERLNDAQKEAEDISTETEEIVDEPQLSQFQWVFEYIDENGQSAQMIIDDAPVTESVSNEPEVVWTPTNDKRPAEVAPVLTPSPQVAVEKSATLEETTIELPPERMGASMFCVGNQVVVYGGISEVKDKEITFDDCWSLDLNARDKWVKKIEGTMDQQIWLGEDESSGDEEDSEFGDSDFSDSADESSGEENSDESSEDEKEEVTPEPQPKKSGIISLKEKMEKIRSEHDLTESYTPLVGETLKDFYARTQVWWSKKVVEDAIASATESVCDTQRIDINDKKEVRRMGFGMAGKRFETTASILAKLKEYEEEQAETEAKTSKSKRGSNH